MSRAKLLAASSFVAPCAIASGNCAQVAEMSPVSSSFTRITVKSNEMVSPDLSIVQIYRLYQNGQALLHKLILTLRYCHLWLRQQISFCCKHDKGEDYT